MAVHNLRKSFGQKLAVADVSFDVQPGEVFGLLGPNGAGKTTTIRMLLDIFKPDAGAIEVLGGPLTPARKDRIGYMPEERGLYPSMRVLDCLVYLGTLKGLSRQQAHQRAEAYLERFMGRYNNNAQFGHQRFLGFDLTGFLLNWEHLGLLISVLLAAYILDQILAALGLLRVSGGAGSLLFSIFNSIMGLSLLYAAYFVPHNPQTPVAIAASLFPLTAPLVLLAIARLIVLSPVIGVLFILPDADGELAIWLGLFPLTAPLLMPFRLLLGPVPLWQWGLGVFGLMLWATGSIWLNMRLFRAQGLLTGRTVTPRAVWAAITRNT